jgi:hypothetical protein
MNKDMKDYLFCRLNGVINLVDEVMDEVAKWEVDATPDEEEGE